MTAEPHLTPGRDLGAYLTRYPTEITFGDEDAEVVFDRYHTPDFVMQNDGVRLDRGRLLDHVRPARARATGVDVQVHQVLASGERVAARYTLTATMRRGPVVATEIHMFGELAPDGRLRSMVQLTRALPAERHAPQPSQAPSG